MTVKTVGEGKITSPEVKQPTSKELWLRCKQENRVRATNEEAIRHLDIEFPQQLPVGIAWIGDQHLDDPRANLIAAERDATAVATTDGLYIGSGGDELNWYIKQLERFPKFDDPDLPVIHKVQLFEYWLDLVSHKMLFMLAGNHNFYLYGRSGLLYERGLATNRNIHYAKDYLDVSLGVGGIDYSCMFTHAYWGQSRLNPIHELLRFARHANARVRPDLVAVAHRHDGLAASVQLDGKKIVLLKSGSYKPNAADYEGQASIPESTDEMPMAIFMPDEKRIIPFDSIPIGARVLKNMRDDYKKGKRNGREKRSRDS